MKLDEYVNHLKLATNVNLLPHYIQVDDVNESQVFIDGKWTNRVYCWGMVIKEEYIFFVSDDERGYVSDLKKFAREEDLVEYVKNNFQIRLAAKRNISSQRDMMARYIQKKFDYSEKRANSMVSQMARYNDFFDEFFNYIRINKMQRKDGTKVTIAGYTAEKLMEQYNLSVIGAYNFLVYLREDPKEALADLKAILPRK